MKHIGKIMKRFCISVILLILVFACGPLPEVEEAEGTAVLGNPDLMAQVCATGYTRTAPHFCFVTATPGTAVTLTADNTCRSVDFTSAYTPVFSSAAKVGLFRLDVTLKTANAIANRMANFAVYGAAACGSLNAQYRYGMQEFVATATTQFNIVTQTLIAPLVNGVFYYTANDNSTGSAPVFAMVPIGYYD
jgi:hypothetical protein